MSEANLYGPIVTRRRVATLLRDHLLGANFVAEGGWALHYLREVQRIEGWAAIDPDPANWPPAFRSHRFTVSENTVVNLPENDLPALLIGSPGLARSPEVSGEERELEGTWVVGLHALVSGNDEDSTDRLAGEYAAALMAACAQQRVIGDDLAEIVAVSDMAFDPLPQFASRTLAAGTVTVSVVVEDMVRMLRGPVTLPADPDVDPGELVEIDTASLTVDRLEVE